MYSMSRKRSQRSESPDPYDNEAGKRFLKNLTIFEKRHRIVQCLDLTRVYQGGLEHNRACQRDYHETQWMDGFGAMLEFVPHGDKVPEHWIRVRPMSSRPTVDGKVIETPIQYKRVMPPVDEGATHKATYEAARDMHHWFCLQQYKSALKYMFSLNWDIEDITSRTSGVIQYIERHQTLFDGENRHEKREPMCWDFDMHTLATFQDDPESEEEQAEEDEPDEEVESEYSDPMFSDSAEEEEEEQSDSEENSSKDDA